MTTKLRTVLAGVALAAAVLPATAGAAPKHHRAKAKRAVATKPQRVAAAAPTAVTPAPAPAAPAVNSVISIGGYVFYNLTYAEAVAAYQAAVAAAPAGYKPPPVTSISVTTTVGGSVQQ